ncbi:MAG: PEP-CTERM sorting domain-containing protein [Pirellulales bacterium]|nr:PEP-CTERM sorting domain-containing protein [Pirellulales bacterium]
MKARFLLFFLCSMALLAGSAYADVIADFTNGNDNTTFVDAFHGIAGGGWSGPWEESNNGKGTVTNTADNSNPISGGGYYLSCKVEADGTDDDVRSGVGRNHGAGVDGTVPLQIIEFDYRLDEDVTGEGSTFNTYQDRYTIEDGPAGTSTPSSSATWQIFGYGGTGDYCPAGREMEWTFCDGTNSSSGSLTSATWADTDVPLVGGAVYHFTVYLDTVTQTWDATVSTTIDETEYSYDSNEDYPDGMGWRRNAIMGNYIHFTARTYDAGNVPDDVREFSVDNIRIIPEPSTLVLLCMGLLGLAAYGRRHR